MTFYLVVSGVLIIFSIAGLIFFSRVYKRLLKQSKDLKELADKLNRQSEVWK
jgi:preprotein translocase subunit YajC